ncbi:glycosyltransferase [Candidatus Pelagibacter sp.]|nr:glycosyltransferase [Candidatus Pelagibacter sp.]
MKFSIVIPVYNESKNLPLLISQIYKVLENHTFELIIIDDNSSDGTFEVLNKIKKKNFRFFIRKKKRDLSRSCVLGFNKSKYKNILVMDGDLQHQPKDIKKLLKIFQYKKAHIVIGSRELFTRKKHNLSFMRLSASRILIFIVNILLGNKTSDPMSGFFIFKKEIFIRNKYKLFNKGYKILMDLIYLDEKYPKIYDVKINFANRKKGESKMNMKILLSLIYMIIYKLYAKIL